MSRLHPFARLSVAAIGLMVLLTIAGTILTVGYIATQVGAPGQNPDQLMARAAQWSTENGLWLTLVGYPAGVLWLWFCRAQFDRRSFISLGLRRPHLGSNLMRGLLAGFLAIAVVWAMLWVTGTISVNGWSEAARAPNIVLALLGWMLAFAAVGFFEEFLFRGYTLHNLTNWLGWKWAVLVQATIFALIHLGNVATAPRDAKLAALGAMPSIFLIGVFFALSYRKTGSLWFPIGFHAAWNFSLGCLFSLPVSGIKTFQLLDVQSNTNAFLSGGTFGAEGSFLLPPVILALIWFMWQAPDHPQALLDLELVQPAPAQPPIVAPVVAAQPAELAPELAAEEDRENRYRTKFGTSAGFDETMLRELRELQQAREENEAQTRREREVGQTAVQTELLKPTVVIEKAEPEIVEEAVVVTPEVIIAPEVAPVEEKSDEEVVVAQTIAEKPTVQPTEKPATPTVEEAPNLAPVPAPPKKARPKW